MKSIPYYIIRLFLPLALICLTLISCKKESKPSSCFELADDDVEVNKPVQFRNCSSNATGFFWDFGDGTTSDKESPTHTYTEPGFYGVTLSALGKDGSGGAQESMVVEVKQRFLQKIDVVLIEFERHDSLGATPWDGDQTGPDCRLVFGDDALGADYISTLEDDVNSSRVPFTWTFGEQEVRLTDKTWIIRMLDDDFPADHEIMFEDTLNPVARNGNPIRFEYETDATTDKKFILDFHWQLK